MIEVQHLTRQFGPKKALDGVSLVVPRGAVFGLVGANGAGKTTLIRHLLGLLNAQSGSVRVFGLDPVREPQTVLGRIGYLSEENDLPGWMRIDELLRYTRAFYPNWDDAYANELGRTFELNPRARIKHLSKGQRARAGLILALAHRPELLLLDEPSSGLDPIVRRDILGAILRTIAQEGRTVLFSSHLLHEVERVSDSIAMIDHGKLTLCGDLDEIRTTHHSLTLRFEELQSKPPLLTGALAWQGEGREWTAIVNGPPEDLPERAALCGAQIVDQRGVSLDEIFLARAAGRQLVFSEHE